MLTGTGFASEAVYPTIPKPAVNGSLRFYGSYLGTDASTGSVYTQWYRPAPEIYIWVCGYPNRAGNRLTAEVETQGGDVVQIPVSPGQDPAEFWSPKRISLASIKSPRRLRIVATDGSISPAGWEGFSQPFVTPHGLGLSDLAEILLVISCTIASFVIFLSPGFIVRQALEQHLNRHLSFVWIPFPGILLLALIAISAWIGPSQLSPRVICKLALWLLIAYVIYRFKRTPLSTCISPIEQRVLLFAIVLASISVAKATYSLGPPGELFGDTISRTLEVGRRSDSRLPYHIIQLIAWRGTPFGPLASNLYMSYGVWNFSHRGALTSLAEGPIVLAAPVRVPATMPDQPWTVFDPEGFSAFRISAIVLACCGLLAVFGLSRLFLNDDWALLAFLVTVTAPFVLHEVYFTWPKLEAAAFTLLAAYLVMQRREFMAGLALGFGYLCHPSALLMGPALAALVFLKAASADRRARNAAKNFFPWVVRNLALIGGLAIGIILWRLVNGRHFEQGMFLSYLVRADGGPRTLAYWGQHRLDAIWKTLVPLHTFVYHRNDQDATSVYGLTGAPVLFCLQFWTGVPFGAGIAYFFCLLRLLVLESKSARLWLLLLFCIPFAIFVIFWGVGNTGLLREGLHAWFIGLMIFSVCLLNKMGGGRQLFWKILNWTLLARCVDILLMLLFPTIQSQPTLIQGRFAISDTLSLMTMIAGTFWLCWATFRQAEALRKSSPL